MPHPTLPDWITRNSIPFSPDTPESIESALSRFLPTLHPSTTLLALGEPLHGGDAFLTLRNSLFQHLALSHGYTAIALESSFPRSHVLNTFLTTPDISYDSIQDTAFSHNFGRLTANRELLDWMRSHNSDPSHPVKLHCYGFDAPTEMTGADSPRELLHLTLTYLSEIDPSSAQSRRTRIDPLLAPDPEWSNPAAAMDPTKSIGLSPAATSLRLETENLLTELNLRRPELISKTSPLRFAEAAHHASLARHLLTYHATLATDSPTRIATLLGLRDLMMADTLAYLTAREQSRTTDGKLLAFAHNTHLQRSQAHWQWGPHSLYWWPAGAHLAHTLGPRYANIATALAASPDNGISPPEPQTLEHLLTTHAPGPARLLPTHNHPPVPPNTPPRSPSPKNPTYFPLTPQSLDDFDALLTLDSTPYTRGGPPLP